MTRKNRLFILTVFVAGVVVLSGCSTKDVPQSSARQFMPVVQLSPDQVTQKERAVAAKNELVGELLGELSKSMGEKGPAKSISVCKTRAPEIAKSVSAKTGIRIGRTSFQLRNSDNVSPAWAAPFVNDKVEQEIAIELPGDALGVLLPIRLSTTCTLCHGDDSQVLPEVKAAIVSNYPNDQATGFSEGDIRGYFWAEVPQNE